MKKEVKPDVVELINKVREDISFLSRKIDTLIARPIFTTKPPEPKPFQPQQQPGQSQQPAHNHNQPAKRQENGFRERVLFKAVCADCKKECEVPFKPSGERPVYCKDCFSKRKSGGTFKSPHDNRPRPAAPAQPVHTDKPVAVEKKKPAAKKKPASKKKKK
jgi:hypothetical protein